MTMLHDARAHQLIQTMSVEDYILNLENPLHVKLVSAADTLIESLIPQVHKTIKWRLPFYEYHKHLCYINPKKDGIEICFLQGKLLSNEHDLLQAQGRKAIMGIKITSLEELFQDEVAQVFLEAATVNEDITAGRETSVWSALIKKNRKNKQV